MRYGIISDVHSNYEALTSVLRFLAEQSIDKYLCLGDIVGYCAEPHRCIEEARKLNCDFVAGNHDFAAVEKLSIDYFNIFAKESTIWTQENIEQSDRDFLSSQPLVLDYGEFTIVHGSLYMPEAFGYVQTIIDALYSFRELKNSILFIGHSHVPITFVEHASISFSVEDTIRIEPEKRYIINVGSTGQPRDEDPRACCAIYDTDAKIVRICRNEYDIYGAAEKITKAGLPVINAERLKIGR